MMTESPSRETRFLSRSSSRACTENVQPSSGFVHEDDARLGDQVAGDLQPLLHAAGKSLGEMVDAVGTDFHFSQPLCRGFADVAIVPGSGGHEPFAQVGPSGDAKAQTIAGILMNHAEFGAQQFASDRFGAVVYVNGAELIGSVADSSVRRVESARQTTEQGGLTRAGLADNPHDFTGPQVEADVLAADHRAVIFSHALGRESLVLLMYSLSPLKRFSGQCP